MFLLSVLCSLSALTVQAQSESQGSSAIRVILGEDTMIPGYQVTIPCMLENPEDVEVGKIELEVAFPNAKTSFDSVRRGLISDQIGAEIQYDVQPLESNPAVSVVRLSIAPKEKVAIPEGFLFDLVFSINKDVAVNDPPVVLTNRARVFALDLLEPLDRVETQDGLIRVVAEPPPIASCFFYMH
ncbi:MAG: hypothetical protein HYX74_03035 [Acidobacteria bacterium]|nr:hypothetical protein [Acidobacteriota bacterium]